MDDLQEQRPWREWPEYGSFASSKARVVDVPADLTALLARVWEARRVA